MSSSNQSYQQRCNFSSPSKEFQYDGTNFQLVLTFIMSKVQLEAPMIGELIIRQKLPPFSPHNENCMFKASSNDKSAIVVESPSSDMIMLPSASDKETQEKFVEKSASQSSSEAPKVPVDRRSSGGHAIFGSFGLMDDSFGKSSESVKADHGEYFDGDPFGVERCKTPLAQVSEVIGLEYQFSLALKSVCAFVMMCLCLPQRNHLLTNDDFKKAASVGRPDVMLLLMRLMDLSHTSSINRKNLLDASSFLVFRKFLTIQQDGQSLANYEKRFLDQLTGLNTMGALVSATDEVQLLLNNIWGQLFYQGLSPDYNKMKGRLLEKQKLEYPHVTITSAVENAKEFHRHVESQTHVFGKGNQNVGANACSTPNESTASVHAKGSPAAKKAIAADKKKLMDECRVKMKKEMDERIDVRVVEIKANYAKLQSKLDKANAYQAKPMCHLCGYNKGHHTHACSSLSSAQKAQALVVYNEQVAYRKKQSSSN